MKTNSIKILRVVRTALFILVILAFHVSCDDYFDFSPYGSDVDSKYKNTTQKNLVKLENSDTATKEIFKIAIISDSHYWYHELDEAIVDINSRGDIDFVISAGDIADHGLLTEFELFYERMEKLDIPYFTAIGNHDYRSNGEFVYDKMFGNRNYSFIYNHCRFVVFDDVLLESNRRPDYEWLELVLSNEGDFNQTIVVAHLPPFSLEYNHDEECEKRYKSILAEHEASLSIHGHVHRFSFKEYYNDGVMYLTVDAANDKQYSIVTFYYDGGFIMENIKY